MLQFSFLAPAAVCIGMLQVWDYLCMDVLTWEAELELIWFECHQDTQVVLYAYFHQLRRLCAAHTRVVQSPLSVPESTQYQVLYKSASPQDSHFSTVRDRGSQDIAGIPGESLSHLILITRQGRTLDLTKVNNCPWLCLHKILIYITANLATTLSFVLCAN